jgi:hypothetical protein
MDSVTDIVSRTLTIGTKMTESSITLVVKKAMHPMNMGSLNAESVMRYALSTVMPYALC